LFLWQKYGRIWNYANIIAEKIGDAQKEVNITGRKSSKNHVFRPVIIGFKNRKRLIINKQSTTILYRNHNSASTSLQLLLIPFFDEIDHIQQYQHTANQYIDSSYAIRPRIEYNDFVR
jgi:hypothetical protein